MLIDLLSALEGSALAAALRNSVWLYPLVNAGHIVGVALLVGGAVPLGLRYLGLWPSVPAEGLRRVLGRSCDAGFAMTVVSGFLLFVARATAYAASPFFRAKMFVLGTAVVFTVLMRLVSAPRSLSSQAVVRVLAAASVASWIAVLTLGRLIGYF